MTVYTNMLWLVGWVLWHINLLSHLTPNPVLVSIKYIRFVSKYISMLKQFFFLQLDLMQCIC